jgi:hypothetical protein
MPEGATLIRDAVQEKYSRAAQEAAKGNSAASCCSSACCDVDAITSNLYGAEQTGSLPEEAVLASLGCGNVKPPETTGCCAPDCSE